MLGGLFVGLGFKRPLAGHDVCDGKLFAMGCGGDGVVKSG